ncbi:MAG TPA: hypothetical protein VGD02_03200 [Gemmatimonadaceae bacterium]
MVGGSVANGQAPSSSRFKDPEGITADPTGLRRDPSVRVAPPKMPRDFATSRTTGAPIVAFVIDTTGQVEMETVSFVRTSRPEFMKAVCEMLPRFRYLPFMVGDQKWRVLLVESFAFTCPAPGRHKRNRTRGADAGRLRDETNCEGRRAAISASAVRGTDHSVNRIVAGLTLVWLIFPGLREPAPLASTKLPGNVVDVVARDFFLQAPDTIPAGLTTIRLRVTQGEHIVVIAQLDSGHTAADLLRNRHEGRPHPAWMHMIGGPGFPGTGSNANATMMLTPGDYVLMCDVAAPDGVRHFEKGMFRPLVVRAVRSDRSAAQMLPRPDVVVNMRDYAFELSQPISAGARVLRVVNAGSVTHEFRLVHVLAGHTAKESLAWTPASKAPRPDEDVMALVGIGPGHELTTTVSIAQGEDVLLCVPQIEHGMIRAIRVGSQPQSKAGS